MNWLFRPSLLVPAWAALTLIALFLLLAPTWQGLPANRAVPRPVPAGDQEIVWLNNATNAVAWERFVAGVRLLEEHSDLGLRVADDANAFPGQTTAVPELAVTVGNNPSRLWFRWYKLTGELGADKWVQALVARDPPPLAVVGGGSSDRARDLAKALSDVQARLASPPLLVITSATADQVELDQYHRDLMRIYPGRSFRFCYTDRQMAAAVIDFIWGQEDLRPDAEPIYLVRWEDDPYSKDLFDCFREVLSGPSYNGPRRRGRLAQSAVRAWSWAARFAVGGGAPPPVGREGLLYEQLLPPQPSFWSAHIPYSVGAYSEPNRWEAEAAERLMDDLDRHEGRLQPLLILPAMPQPARRFLRGLIRTGPRNAENLVVATGDAVDFNTVYRDRRLAWPIQDLPFALVFFCHRNPVDPVAFEPHRRGAVPAEPQPDGRSSTGTQDLLLYRDIAEAVAEAAYHGGRLTATADALREHLADAKGRDGRPRFDAAGNPLSGAGEYVVYLKPDRSGGRVWPRAFLQVWNRATDNDGRRRWAAVPVAGQAEFTVNYTQR
jgi:hypothetical protein